MIPPMNVPSVLTSATGSLPPPFLAGPGLIFGPARTMPSGVSVPPSEWPANQIGPDPNDMNSNDHILPSNIPLGGYPMNQTTAVDPYGNPYNPFTAMRRPSAPAMPQLVDESDPHRPQTSFAPPSPSHLPPPTGYVIRLCP